MFKTVLNLIILVLIVVAVVIFSGGNFETLKDNGGKAIHKIQKTKDSLMEVVD